MTVATGELGSETGFFAEGVFSDDGRGRTVYRPESSRASVEGFSTVRGIRAGEFNNNAELGSIEDCARATEEQT